ncbi:MAG: hypothetical protein ACOY71_02450 [Gemmatimonadota bacterium]
MPIPPYTTGVLRPPAFAPDRRWRRGLGPVTTVEGRPSQLMLDHDAVFDTVIDVFDLGSNTLLATHRIDAVYQFVVAPGVIAGVREEDAKKMMEISGSRSSARPSVNQLPRGCDDLHPCIGSSPAIGARVSTP